MMPTPPDPNTDDTLTPPAAFHEACRTLSIQLEPHELTALGRYLHLLLETNRKFNLTAIREPEQAWRRHILDSISLLPFLEDASTLIDVGSGGGLPGLPLAIIKPALHVTLLEATGKKARFLEEAAQTLGLKNVTVVNDRAETAGQDKHYRQQFDLAVGRAIGPMNVLLELTLPLVRPAGRVLAMKGKNIEAELRDAGDALMLLGAGDVEVYDALPGLEEEALIVEIAKASPTPRTYPRRPGTPKHEPL